MSDQTEREARWSEAVRDGWERNSPAPAIALADQEQAELHREWRTECDLRQIVQERLRAVEALLDEWESDSGPTPAALMEPRDFVSDLRAFLASPVESDAEGAS